MVFKSSLDQGLSMMASVICRIRCMKQIDNKIYFFHLSYSISKAYEKCMQNMLKL